MKKNQPSSKDKSHELMIGKKLTKALGGYSLWDEPLWELFTACLYWNGFPPDWTIEDLIRNYDRVENLEEKEKQKLLSRTERVIKMREIFLSKAEEGLVHFEKVDNKIYVTAHEFTRFVVAQKKPPAKKLLDDLAKASPQTQLSIFDLCQKRAKTPGLASRVIQCKIQSQRMLHRAQSIALAKDIYDENLAQTGEKLTPKNIFRNGRYQTGLNSLRSAAENEHEIIISYDEKVHITKWIPAAIREKRPRGRPKMTEKTFWKNLENPKT